MLHPGEGDSQDDSGLSQLIQMENLFWRHFLVEFFQTSSIPGTQSANVSQVNLEVELCGTAMESMDWELIVNRFEFQDLQVVSSFFCLICKVGVNKALIS